MLHNLLDFHQPCVLCGANKASFGWCCSCLKQLEQSSNIRCSCCASPLAAPASFCGVCLKHRPEFSSLQSGLIFSYPLSGLVHAWKYQPRYELSAAMMYLARLYAPQYTEYDFIVPVPLSRQRMAERGYNQSSILAQSLAKHLKVKFSDKLCWRKRDTLSQAHLRLKDRQKNLRNAFEVNESVSGLSILLVDDVATSCSTLSELAKRFNSGGAKVVDAWVLARAILH